MTKSGHYFEPVEGRRKRIGDDLGHVAAETFLLTRLTFTLLSYLGLGYRWVSKLIALFCYAILLLPGFLQVACFYYYSSRIHRSIIYGDQPRNRLDLYLPLPCQKPKPVVIFVIGGAWIIGYKAWGSFLGLQLAERGIIVACLDYRNFPQGTISDMVKDVSQGISFVLDNIVEYGGDPNRVYLMGQSAGAHISACALLAQAVKETQHKKSDYCSPSWSVLQLKGYFGLSGGYNLPRLVDHFDRRGLYRSIFLSIMEGEDSLQRYSPELMVQELSGTTALSKLPPIALFHGTADCSIPCDSSESFADTLKNAGANAEMILYRGKTHTDLFIQDPLRGGRDELLEDLVTRVQQQESEEIPPVMYRRMVPEPLLQMARKVSPF